MANIKIAGGAAVLVSTLKLEAIRLLERYRPNALVLREDDDVVFRVQSGNTGSVSQHGVCFATTTRNEAALAELTLSIPADVTDAKEFAMDKIGPALLQLNHVEAQAAAELAALNEDLTQVRDTITVV